MATIHQFARRLAESQDWSPSERAQLREMGMQLASTRFDLDVVFGKSDDGDPWCVVTDQAGEVILHVARIAGVFIVHSAIDDEIAEGRDLWAAALELLGDVLKDRRGVLLPFSAETLTQHAILAFMFSAALRGEFGDLRAIPHLLRPPADNGPLDGHHDGQVWTVADGHARPDWDAAQTHAGAPAVASEAAAPKAAEAPALEDPPAPVGQTTVAPPEPAPADTAAQSLQAARDQSGASASAMPVIPLEKAQLILGGAGDDHILMSAHVVAAGGQGADTFVLPLPSAPSAQSVFLGVILDFHESEGDRLQFSGTGHAAVVSDRPEANLLADLGPTPYSAADPVPGRRIGYDVDGNGSEDAYVLVGGATHAWVDRAFGSGGKATAAAVGTPAPSPVHDAPEPPPSHITSYGMDF